MTNTDQTTNDQIVRFPRATHEVVLPRWLVIIFATIVIGQLPVGILWAVNVSVRLGVIETKLDQLHEENNRVELRLDRLEQKRRVTEREENEQWRRFSIVEL